MSPEAQLIATMRGQVGGIALGSIFLFIGLAAIFLAALRHRGEAALMLWFGVFSGLYGLRMLAQAPAAFALLPSSTWNSRPYVIAIITYLIFVPALLFWLELSIGRFRWFLRAAVIAAALFAMVAITASLIQHQSFLYTNENSIFAIIMMLVLGIVNVVRPLARRWLKEPSPVLAGGAVVLAVVALLNNIGTFIPGFPNLNRLEPIGFAAFVFSLGYVATQNVFSNERRLLAIQSELDIAREIQKSILPTSVPQLQHLRVAASYHPMTSVAGDFYEFLHLDEKHVGFLVADVSGHGVPAALIASMIKVAMHSVASQASAPDHVMRGLNHILSNQLRGQFVTAAYLYVDLEQRRALYSAAGHPPLLYWAHAQQKLQKIECNGLLFGVLPESNYPACELTLQSGDRLLLYTDGLIEAENSTGEAFGEARLMHLIGESTELTAAQLTTLLLEELKRWPPRGELQQDDVTLIVIDLL